VVATWLLTIFPHLVRDPPLLFSSISHHFLIKSNVPLACAGAQNTTEWDLPGTGDILAASLAFV
jgi:hypothetical protein